MEAMTAKGLVLHYAYYLHIETIVHAVTDGTAVNGASTAMQPGPSQDWGCGGQLGIFAFVLWPRVDAWLGC